MKPAPFDLERPTRLEDVLALLAIHGENARLIAGGQTLVPLMNLRMATPNLLIDLNRVPGLSGIRLDGDTVRIGAMTRQKELMTNQIIAQHVPLAAKAIPHIGHVQTRSRGTVGGSIALADPAAELPVVMVALEATFTLQSQDATRTIAACDFFEDIMSTALRSDEVLVEIAVPAAPANSRTSFHEFARRHGDFAIASCGAQFIPDSGTRRLDIALGGVGHTPHRCSGLISKLASAGYDRAAVEQAVEEEVATLMPLEDLQADATLRRRLARVALTRCLNEVLQ